MRRRNPPPPPADGIPDLPKPWTFTSINRERLDAEPVPPVPATPAERLIVQPGDTLVLRLPAWATEYDRDRNLDRAREQLPAAVGIVVVAGDELAVIRPDTRHLEVQPAEPDSLLTEPGVPRRVRAIELARAHEEIRTALDGTPERERIPWDNMPVTYRTRLANVFDEMIGQGLIKP